MVEKYSTEKSQEETDLMRERIKNGETKKYSEAEKIIETGEVSTPFAVNVECANTKDFYELSKKFGFKNIIDFADDIANLGESTLEEKLLLYQIADQINELRRKKIDLESMDLAFKYVGEKPDLNISDIIEQAKLSGGKSPFDKDIGMWASGYDTIGKSLEFLQMNDNAVIFIYDKSKLTPVEANETTDVYANTWKMKPKDNLELKDVLAGMIIIKKKE